MRKLSVILLILTLCVFVPKIIMAGSVNLPRDSKGWTIFTPSTDSRILYVSASGNDHIGKYYKPNDVAIGSNPFVPIGPVLAYATYAAAYSQTRDGYPDWVLIKRGDTFVETIDRKIRNGRSASEPFLISAYGDSGHSPIFNTGVQRGISLCCHGFRWIAISGISFNAHTRDPGSANYIGSTGSTGLNFFVGKKFKGQGLLVEGCRFSFFTNNVITADGAIDGVDIRRSVFIDNYSDAAHSQGLYVSRAEVKLEENIFDHNGWYAQSSKNKFGKNIGVATIFNHNIYFANVFNTTLRGNIFLRPSSINNKFTANYGVSSSKNIVIDGNLYVDGEVAISIGGNKKTAFRFKDIILSNNVVTDIGRSRPTNRNLGWGFDIQDWDGGVVANNFLINQPLSLIKNVHGIRHLGTSRNVSITGNIFYGLDFSRGFVIDGEKGVVNAKNMIFSNNIVQLPKNARYLIDSSHDAYGEWIFLNNFYYIDGKADAGIFRVAGRDLTYSAWQRISGDDSVVRKYKFPDPNKTLVKYQESLGAPPTIDSFINACRAQDRFDWKADYTANVVNAWIKKGFGECLRITGSRSVERD